ncbi:MAG: hypothetical protein HeimC3_24840 [Candidatus Heimdallarchaeota archaeon LC_3]|nr:MAG: hypothetical protein HeimC3_24840 [Candidatus Heimdallarchaeota archaeon LC_3]
MVTLEMKSLKPIVKVVIPLILLASLFIVASAASDVQPAKEAQTAIPDRYFEDNVGLNKEAQTAIPDRILGFGQSEASGNLGDN